MVGRLAFCAAVQALLIALLPPPALAVGAEAKSKRTVLPWLKAQVERARLLGERKVKVSSPEEKVWQEDIKKVVDEILDWDELTERSLGKHWKDLKPEQRSRFAGLLREMIESSYRSKMRAVSTGDAKKPAKVEIEWQEEKIDGETATAKAKVKADKTVALVDFSLTYDNDAGWRVYDVAIDDVSSVRTYRSQFGKLITKEGFDTLISRMEKRVKDIQEGRADIGP